MIDKVWLVLLFPLLGFLINGLFGWRFRKGLINFIACGSVGLSFLVSLGVFLELLKLAPEARHIEKLLFPWVVSGSFKTAFSFLVDPLSALMILTVSGVAFLIHIYSTGYMHDDPGYVRYFSYLNLFTFSMLLLVLANNLLLMYIGWEAVGLCSYLLIGFWYEKKSASDAGKKAFIVNRIGDFGFALGIMLTFVTFGTVMFTPILEKAPEVLHYGGATATAITLLLFLGAVGKSAQIPLYVWLPDAMEGPTPVSALIHAATMVTAGVYMVARLSALYLMAPASMLVVAIVGGVTALYAASIGLMQNDIKRVLAYSTISQLGYMFLACGVGAFAAGIFHLMTHAFFKALLFMCAGSVMHALAGELNIQKMGGLKKYLPITYWTFLAGTLAISGIPGFSGFFSKDEILWRAFSSGQGHFLLWLLGALGALMTAFYMFRLLFLTFHGKSRLTPEVERHVHESPSNMGVPLIILAALSVIGGYVGIPHVLGGGNRIERFLDPAFGHLQEAGGAHHSGGLELLVMVISVLIALGGIYLAYLFYIKNTDIPKKLAERYRSIYTLIYNKYYVDEIYNALVVQPLKFFAIICWRLFDVIIIDGIANGLAKLVGLIGGLVKRFETGYVRNYALGFVIGVVVILGYFMLR
jgi:NADH-quinone oxidoreductase subunit L